MDEPNMVRKDGGELATRRVQLIVSAVGIAITVFLSGASLVNRLQHDISELDRKLAAADTRCTEHLEVAREWKQRIVDNERMLKTIISNPSTIRPDPFTETDGKALERRIKEIEKKVGKGND